MQIKNDEKVLFRNKVGNDPNHSRGTTYYEICKCIRTIEWHVVQGGKTNNVRVIAPTNYKFGENLK